MYVPIDTNTQVSRYAMVNEYDKQEVYRPGLRICGGSVMERRQFDPRYTRRHILLTGYLDVAGFANESKCKPYIVRLSEDGLDFLK
jgi:hypothetical protein